jgi:hypothetical protein
MSVTFPVSLGKVEVITERPFTHTDHITKDRDILIHMAKEASLILEKKLNLLEERKTVFIDEPDDRYHRFFISKPLVLSQAKDILYLVGFFSHKQDGAARDHFGDLDDKLIEQIPTYQGILSYSTMVLPDGNFGNLVLITDEEIKSKWLHGEIHSQAVALSPAYYQFVRINNGILPNGVMEPEALEITRVKYYDYTENPPWKAVRELTQG